MKSIGIAAIIAIVAVGMTAVGYEMTVMGPKTPTTIPPTTQPQVTEVWLLESTSTNRNGTTAFYFRGASQAPHVTHVSVNGTDSRFVQYPTSPITVTVYVQLYIGSSYLFVFSSAQSTWSCTFDNHLTACMP